MYINSNDSIRNIFSNIEKLDDVSRLRILIYIFNLINNNQINDRNEVNPNLYDDLKIFKFSTIGLSDNHCDIFIQYLISIYNVISDYNKVIYINGNVEEMSYSSEEKKIISLFDKLNFNDKLDFLGELFIRYDNETYFKEKITIITFDSNRSGYDLANNILMFKESD
jgi:hypothetical protein